MKLIEIKKVLLQRGFKISKIRNSTKNNSYKSLYFTFLTSLFLVSFFFILPKGAQYTAKFFSIPLEIKNNSKVDFDKTFSQKKKNIKSTIDDDTDSEHLYDDIEMSDIITDHTIRLTAATLEEIFKSGNYYLKNVRKNKSVNVGYSVDRLPVEIKNIENVKKRKNLFIKIVLPLILEENTRIKLDRKKLFVILNKSINNKQDKAWLNSKFKQYGVMSNDLSTLKIRMDEIPISLAIAQAAKETGWGTSRFAIQGNALFGQWTWNGDGIKPAAADSNTTHKIMRFRVLKASVRAYQRNLNTHSSYKKFRKERAIQRDNDEKLNSLELVSFLDKYAETGIEYTKTLKKIIEQNSLTDFDDAKMLPTSNKLKNLI